MRPELSNWISELETAERLGVSVRTLLRMVAQGTAPMRRQRPRPGGKKPEAVYDPDQVAHMEQRRREELQQTLAAGDPRLPGENGAHGALTAPGVPSHVLGGLLERIAAALEALLSRSVPEPAPQLPAPPEKSEKPRYFRPKEAAEYLGVPEPLVRRLVRLKRLPVLRDRHGLLIAKAHLDNPDMLAGVSPFWKEQRGGNTAT